MAALLTPKLGAARGPEHHAPKYTVTLGPSLRESDGRPATRYSTASFNHKPSQTTRKRSTVLTKGASDTSAYNLVIRDEEEDTLNATEETRYIGRQHKSEDTYILILNEDTQTYTLDLVGPQYSFNMISAPWQHDTSKLERDYKQILMLDETANGEDGTTQDDHSFPPPHHDKQDDAPHVGSGGEETLDEPPDPSNPFDYRHYINSLSTIPTKSESRNPSVAGTPIIRPRAGTGTSLGAGSPLAVPRPSTALSVTAPSSASLASRSPAPTAQQRVASVRGTKGPPQKQVASPFFKKERAGRKRAAAATAAAAVAAAKRASTASPGASDVEVEGSRTLRDKGLGIDLGGSKSGRTNVGTALSTTQTLKPRPIKKQKQAEVQKARASTSTRLDKQEQNDKETGNDRRALPRARARAATRDVFEIEIDEDSAFGEEGEEEEEEEEEEPVAADTEDDDDIDAFSLPGPAVTSTTDQTSSLALRRQSTWDADAEAELQASLEEALELEAQMAEEGEEGEQSEQEEREEQEHEREGEGSAAVAVAGLGLGLAGSKADSDSESEEE